MKKNICEVCEGVAIIVVAVVDTMVLWCLVA